jgi:hypothetical protein
LKETLESDAIGRDTNFILIYIGLIS